MTEAMTMVKALSNGQVRVLLSGAQETVDGFAVDEDSVLWARRPTVFPTYPTMRFENAIGSR